MIRISQYVWINITNVASQTKSSHALSGRKCRNDAVKFDTVYCTVASRSYLKVPRRAVRRIYIYIYMYHRTTLNVIGHRPRNSFEIVASTKFLGVRHALKQCASMQVTWGGRFSRSLCQHYLFSKYVTREMWCIKCNKINFKGAYLYYLLTVLIIHR